MDMTNLYPRYEIVIPYPRQPTPSPRTVLALALGVRLVFSPSRWFFPIAVFLRPSSAHLGQLQRNSSSLLGPTALPLDATDGELAGFCVCSGVLFAGDATLSHMMVKFAGFWLHNSVLIPDNANAYTKTVRRKDELIVFPQGLLQIQVNTDTTAVAFSTYISANPGLQIIDYTLFANLLPEDVVTKVTFICEAEVRRLKAFFGLVNKAAFFISIPDDDAPSSHSRRRNLRSCTGARRTPPPAEQQRRPTTVAAAAR